MVPFATVSGIAYCPYTTSDANEMARLLAATFTRRDPPAVALGLTQSEFEELVALLSANTSTQHLTVVARSVETDEMVGALLAEDSNSEAPAGIEHLSPKFDPIFDILGQLETTYRGNHESPTGESVHLFLLGVSDVWSGRGIGRQLVIQCTENAARNGYRLAVAEATNRTSQHIFRSAGFVERVRSSYDEHRFNGQAFFKSIAEQGGPILMDKSLKPEQRESGRGTDHAPPAQLI